jgi:tripartite ATP-independent transporter DctP family solute receptor
MNNRVFGRPDTARAFHALARVVLVVLTAVSLARSASAADTKHYSFGYDQPHTTAYGIAADTFADKLSDLSKGTMIIDAFPGAQLGQEPQMLQKIRSGDIDFMISSTANAATVSPESGVMSLHFVFRDEDHLVKSLADPRIIAAVRQMFEDTVQGGHVLALATLGFRDFYGKKEIHSVADLKGVKVRVQATATEDAIFPAYGAQTVHMPFGNVYTSLQTGVVDMAENGINVYMANKHYETAPIMSLSQHEANNSVIWVSDKVWSALTAEQKSWVQAAADEVSRTEPAKALALERESQVKLQKMGVKFVTDVDKSGFQTIATPFQDSTAKELGPHAVKILELIRSVQ